MRTLPQVVLAGAGLLAAPAAALIPGPVPGSYPELTVRSPSRAGTWRTLQASGWDRGGGFYDSGNFLHEEPGRRFVMLDTAGPGVIDRMWFTRKSTREPYELQLFLDGNREPAVRIDLDDLGEGKTAPFLAPFAGKVDLARWSYAPIGFRRSCKAVLAQTGPAEVYATRENSAGKKIPHVYYQITYRLLDRNGAVADFSAEKRLPERPGFAAARAAWLATAPAEVRERTVVELAPGERREVVRREGSGWLRELQISAPAGTPTGKVWLEVRYDGASAPAIRAPLGLFFAAPDPRVEVQGFWVGNTGSAYYSRLSMPFRKGVRVDLVSEAEAPVRLELACQAAVGRVERDERYLHVRRYDHQPPLPPTDYTVLDVKGRGQWVGLVMDRPGNMEGDDRFYVDGEREPALHGTGTEDFFSFAWGFAHLGSFPLHGITRHGGAPVLYRFHLPAGVPFRKSLRIDWEHGSGNEHQGRYSGLVYYYLDRPE